MRGYRLNIYNVLQLFTALHWYSTNINVLMWAATVVCVAALLSHIVVMQTASIFPIFSSFFASESSKHVQYVVPRLWPCDAQECRNSTRQNFWMYIFQRYIAAMMILCQSFLLRNILFIANYDLSYMEVFKLCFEFDAFTKEQDRRYSDPKARNG